MVKTGQVTVATPGTAVQASTDEATREYWLRAHPSNTGVIAIGNDGADDVTVDNGLILATTDPPFCYFGRLAELWVDAATGGDKLCWMLLLP